MPCCSASLVPYAIGKTKTFLRLFLHEHLIERHREIQYLSICRMQRVQRRRVAKKTAARAVLRALMHKGTPAELASFIPRARRADAGAQLLADAEALLAELQETERMAAQLEKAAELLSTPEGEEVDVGRLGDAEVVSKILNGAVEWLRAHPSDRVLAILPWSRVEETQRAAVDMQAAALRGGLAAASDARDPAQIQQLVQQAREWLETGPPEALAAGVLKAVDLAGALLIELVGIKQACESLSELVGRGMGSDPQALAASIATAELVYVPGATDAESVKCEGLLARARTLRSEIIAAAEAKRAEEQRLKREAEAEKEQARREARQNKIDAKRKVRLEARQKKKRANKSEEDEEDELLSGAAKATVTSAEGVRVTKQVGRSKVTASTQVNPLLVTHRVDKSGWLLKTGSVSSWKPHRWSSRFCVLMGGTLYYFRPQEMAEAAGCIQLVDDSSVREGVSLRSAPPGSFTLTLGASTTRGTKGMQAEKAASSKVQFPFSAGAHEEMLRWVNAMQAAIGRPAHSLPSQSVLEQLAAFSGSVTSVGGTSFAVRIRKHMAQAYASDDDLPKVLGACPPLLPLLRALQRAHSRVHGEDEAQDLNKHCYQLAAKVAVLLRCSLVKEKDLEPAALALRRMCEALLAKEGRVRPTGSLGARLLPGMVAVDPQDPFHAVLCSAMQSVGGVLGQIFAPYVSESSCQVVREVCSHLCAQDVLTVLFGDPLKPTSGIACLEELETVLAASGQYLDFSQSLAQEAESPADAPTGSVKS